MKTLFIITGGNGAIGKAYFEYLAAKKEVCVSLSRTSPYFLDLLNRSRCKKIIQHLDFTNITRIVLIHSVGSFCFEEQHQKRNNAVWHNNFSTFVNIAKPLIERTQKEHITLKLVGFGSPSDSFRIPYWKTFSSAKNAIRHYMKLVCVQHANIQGLIVNISSTQTTNEEKLRPYADKTHWLKPQEIVEQSIYYIEQKQIETYHEIEIIKPNPGFQNYYKKTDAIYKKWMKEMYNRAETD